MIPKSLEVEYVLYELASVTSDMCLLPHTCYKLEPDTTRSNLPLEGVTSNPIYKNDIPSVQNVEVAPPDTATDVGPVKQKISHKLHLITPVTPASTALKGVTLSSPALQSTEGVTTTTKYSDQLTPANPVLGGGTPKTLSSLQTYLKPHH